MVGVHRNPPLLYVVASEGSRRGSVSVVHETSPAGQSKLRLLDRVRAALRTRHYSTRTEEAYVAWNSSAQFLGRIRVRGTTARPREW